MSAATIVFENDDLRVMWQPGASAFVLITFGDLWIDPTGTRFYADVPATKAAIACLGVMPKQMHWYPAASMRAAAEVVLPLLRPYHDRVTYGASMGGYAAVKFSRLFGATEVIALCPQWSIDPAECAGHNSGWAHHFVDSMAGMAIRSDDASGAVFVFSDHCDAQERFHARMIADTCQAVTLINLPRVGHDVPIVLAGSQTFLALIDGCRTHQPVALMRLTRQARRQSHIRIRRLLDWAIGRYPNLAGRMLMRVSGEDARGRAFVVQFLARKVDLLLAGGHRQAACDCIRLLLQHQDAVQEQMLAAALLARLTGTQARIRTHHGTVLAYSFAQRKVVHVPAAADAQADCAPAVCLHLAGTTASLFVELDGASVAFGIDGTGSLAPVFDAAAQPDPVAFAIAAGRGGTFTLQHGGAFLCAEPAGGIICNRPAADDWESFGFS